MPPDPDRWVAVYTRRVVPTVGLAASLLCAGCAVFFFVTGDLRLGWTAAAFAVLGFVAIPLPQYLIRRKGWYRVE